MPVFENGRKKGTFLCMGNNNDKYYLGAEVGVLNMRLNYLFLENIFPLRPHCQIYVDVHLRTTLIICTVNVKGDVRRGGPRGKYLDQDINGHV